MLTKIVEQVTKISDNNEINTQNYLESLNYINRLFDFVSKLKLSIDISNIDFYPSFKGKFTCSKYGIFSDEPENMMKIIVIGTTGVLEDSKEKNRVKDEMSTFCKFIDVKDSYIKFVLN